MGRIAPDLLAACPAPLALFPRRAVDADDEPGDVLALVAHALAAAAALEVDARDDEQRRQQRSLGAEQPRHILGRRLDPHARLQPAADQLLRAGRLQRLGHLAAYLEQAVPLRLERVVEPPQRHLGKALAVDRLRARAGAVGPRPLA